MASRVSVVGGLRMFQLSPSRALVRMRTDLSFNTLVTLRLASVTQPLPATRASPPRHPAKEAHHRRRRHTYTTNNDIFNSPSRPRPPRTSELSEQYSDISKTILFRSSSSTAARTAAAKSSCSFYSSKIFSLPTSRTPPNFF